MEETLNVFYVFNIKKGFYVYLCDFSFSASLR